MKKLIIVLAIALAVATHAHAQSEDSSYHKKSLCLVADIVFVEDWSGSLEKEKLYLANAAQALLKNFSLSCVGTKIGVVKFSDSAQVVTYCTGDNTVLKDSLRLLGTLTPENGTKISLGLELAQELFKRSEEERGEKPLFRIVILVSDGLISEEYEAYRAADNLKRDLVPAH